MNRRGPYRTQGSPAAHELQGVPNSPQAMPPFITTIVTLLACASYVVLVSAEADRRPRPAQGCTRAQAIYAEETGVFYETEI